MIDVFERSAERKAESEAGNGKGGAGQGVFEIEGRGVAFEGGVEGDDELGDGGEASFNAVETEGRGMAVVEGGEEVLDHVVEAVVGVGLFDGVGVTGGGNEAEGGGVAVGAERAVAAVGEAAASGAWGDFRRELEEKGGERGEGEAVPGEEFEGEALGGAGPNARKLFEVGNEGEQVFRKSLGHKRRV